MELIQENELNNYSKALAVTCPIQAGLNRILVIQIRPEYKEELVEENNMPVIKNGSLWLPKYAVAATENAGGLNSKSEVVKAVVKSVGDYMAGDGSIQPGTTNQVNDLVYVFPSVFETIISIDGYDYMSYSARDVVATIGNNFIPPVLEKEMD